MVLLSGKSQKAPKLDLVESYSALFENWPVILEVVDPEAKVIKFSDLGYV